MEVFNKESVYDEQISPLLKQITALCKEHGIPMMASFTFINTAESGIGRCDTLLNNFPERNDPAFSKAMAIVRNGGHESAVTLTIEASKL